MKIYLKEIIILLNQLFMFYLYPLYAIRVDPIGMVLIMLFVTILLSLIIGIISNKKIKYFYPLVISILFIPSVFIYYNGSALVHSLWYFIVSLFGLFLGIIISKIFKW